MKLLLDANISWRLVANLKVYFKDCFHVDHIGIPIPASDLSIWKYALEHQCIIVSNDEDFLSLSTTKGFPPKLILLRTGNQSNSFIKTLLINHKKDISALSISEDYGVLELFEK